MDEQLTRFLSRCRQSYKSPTDSMVSPISRNLLSRKLSRPGSIKLPIKVIQLFQKFIFQ
jgi:hypothetical protein